MNSPELENKPLDLSIFVAEDTDNIPISGSTEDLVVDQADLSNSDAYIQYKERFSSLDKLVEPLGPVAKDIVMSRFGLEGTDHITFRELGVRHGLSTQRVNQVYARSIKKLKSIPDLEKIILGERTPSVSDCVQMAPAGLEEVEQYLSPEDQEILSNVKTVLMGDEETRGVMQSLDLFYSHWQLETSLGIKKERVGAILRGDSRLTNKEAINAFSLVLENFQKWGGVQIADIDPKFMPKFKILCDAFESGKLRELS